MTSSSSLYGSTQQSGTVSSSNYTTLYSGGASPPPNNNLVVPGTLTVNGCAILTNCNAFSLLPTTAETILFGGASTAMSIGSGTGVTTINNQLATANYTFPVADGVSGQVLVTDGSGTISFAAASTVGKTYSIDASTTTGGTNFNLVSSDPSTDTIKFANGTNMTVVRTDADTITFNATDTNTTYNIDATTTTGGANLNLTGSDASTDTVKFASGSGITVTRTDANTITVTNSNPGGTGVTSITGTANQVIASASTGAVTLSLPQDIATTSDPTFSSIILDAGVVSINTQTTTTTSTASASISGTTKLSQKAIIKVTDNVTGEIHILEALAFYKGTTAYLTTYAEMYTNAALAAFTADINAGTLSILATPASANSTTFKVARTALS